MTFSDAAVNTTSNMRSYVAQAFKWTKKYVRENPKKSLLTAALLVSTPVAPVGVGLLVARTGIALSSRDERNFEKNLFTRSTVAEAAAFLFHETLIFGGVGIPVLMALGVIGDTPDKAADRAKIEIVNQIRASDVRGITAYATESYSRIPWNSWHREKGEVKISGTRVEQNGQYFTVRFSDGPLMKYQQPSPPRGYESDVVTLPPLTPKP